MFLIKLNPFHDLSTVQGRVNRIFNDVLHGGDRNETSMWNPAVDIFETSEHLVVTMEVPGVDRSNLDLRLENNVLTVRGERRFELESPKENYHRVERAYGTFTRSFALPVMVDQEKITAAYTDGILRITLPKKEQAKAKRIEIAA